MNNNSKSDTIIYPNESRRLIRIEALKKELAALNQNQACGNSLDYIKKQFCYMFGDDRFDTDGWDKEIRTARISVYTDGNLYRPDTYYTLELTTPYVVILYEYQRVEHYDESWQVFVRLPEKSDGNNCDWILIPNIELIQDVVTDFEQELIYTLLKNVPSSGFEFMTSDYCQLPVINRFIPKITTRDDDTNDCTTIGSLFD